MNYLAACNVRLDIKDTRGRTLLHAACELSLNTVKYRQLTFAYQEGDNAKEKDGRDELVKYLVEHGADIQMK
jgi:ankyrin repeat protein